MKHRNAALTLIFLLFGTQSATAGNFSFTGNFTHDNDVQLFNFSIASTTDVFLQTYSFGGGTNSAGNAISAGGFTPFFSLFEGSGLQSQISASTNPSTCGGSNPANPDPVTGSCWDTFLDLTSPRYRLAVTYLP